jgi:hypothetical protein
MSSIDEYTRKQCMLDNLRASLVELYTIRNGLLTELVKVDKQIEKHEKFRDELLKPKED